MSTLRDDIEAIVNAIGDISKTEALNAIDALIGSGSVIEGEASGSAGQERSEEQRINQEWASWEPETGAEFERDVDALIEAVRLSTLSQQTGTGLNTDHAGDA